MIFACSMCCECVYYEKCFFSGSVIRCNDPGKCEDCPVDCEFFDHDSTCDFVDDDVSF